MVTSAGRNPTDAGSAREIRYPKRGQAFFGQDAHYAGNQPRYEVGEDGTVLDLVTGLVWTRA